MIIRAIDADHDWTFGAGKSNYLTSQKGVIQNINTRLYEFLGDCFFNTGAGIDWFNYLGGKDLTALSLSISATILNTQDVTGILQLSSSLTPSTRIFQITYQVASTYSIISSLFIFNPTQEFG